MLTKAQRVQLSEEIGKAIEEHNDLLSSLRNQISRGEASQEVETRDDSATVHEGAHTRFAHHQPSHRVSEETQEADE